MSVRDRIRNSLPVSLLGTTSADRITDQITAIVEEEISRSARTHVDGARRYVDLLIEQRTGTDQGISRLALLAFVSGEESTQWNGPRVHGSGWPGTAWVRYRGHQIAREVTADGVIVTVGYVDHAGKTRETRFTASPAIDTDSVNLLALGDIDDLLDMVIAEHGVPGGVLAQVATPIAPDDARRVAIAFLKWVRDQPVHVIGRDDIVDRFVTDVTEHRVIL